jgi:beta-phosphoglucomutase-like phosphatase (HAD superfamily)/dTDP-glucose pyrophosphorylase
MIKNSKITQKIVVFDLDGVLLDSKDIHYTALNQALQVINPKYVISPEDHVAIFDGLSTLKKLQILTETRGLDPLRYDEISKLKQNKTIEIFQNIQPDGDLIRYFKKLNDFGIQIAVASNSIRHTLRIALIKLGIIEFVEIFLSNQDVLQPKPNPEIYWECMKRLGAVPESTVIFEDSNIGRASALASGGKLLPVENRGDLTEEKIDEAIRLLVKDNNAKSPWANQKLNIVIPMAGGGSRFEKAGYTFPKPLIEIHGKPMIQVVVENLNIDAHYIFVVQKEHYDRYQLQYLLKLLAPGCDIIQVDAKTEGAACTTLLAESIIDSEAPLLIANCDQIIEWDSSATMYALQSDNIDAGILTFESSHPKWSYAKLNDEGLVNEVAEKQVISNLATVGIYFWKHGLDYVRYAKQMIAKKIRTNGEFYICPVFNEAIADGFKVRSMSINRMWGVGTPEDLNYYLANFGHD